MTPFAERPVERPLYRSGTPPRAASVFEMPLPATEFAGVAFLIALVVGMRYSVLAGVALAAVSAIVLAPLVIAPGGRTLYKVIQLRLHWFGRVANGSSTVYRAGPPSSIDGPRTGTAGDQR